MNLHNRSIRTVAMIIAAGLVIGSCQKLSHPALDPNYPKDTNPPGGPLKFYAAMNGGNVDSIRANFGTDNNVTYVTGLTGQAAQFNGTKNGFINYPTANDFGNSTNFTVNFWINITMAQKDFGHAVGVMSVANGSGFWSDIVFYADNTTKSQSDSMDLKIHFTLANGNDNWDFANYTGTAAWPHMYDGKWHMVTFVYDASAKAGTVYRDGVKFDQKANETIGLFAPSQVVLGGFQQAAGIQGDYPGNTWMAGFPGMMDEVRLYGTALSASDVQTLFTNKQ